MSTLEELGVVIPFDVFGEYRTICPLCSHLRKKSSAKDLCINVEKGVWHCQHCQASGTVNKKIYRAPILPVRSKVQSQCEKFFSSRKISKRTYENAGVFLSNDRIAFPYYEGKKLVTIKYRGKNKTFSFEKECELVLYGSNDISDESLIFVEGEIDYLSLKEVGFNSVVSVPNGAGTNLELLSKYHKKLKNCECFIIAVDNDDAGLKLKDKLIERLGEKKCKIASFPAPCKDANEVLVSFGADALRQCVNASEFCKIKGTLTVSDVQLKLESLRKFGLPIGLSTGWFSLDKYYKVLPGKLDVITGTPGSGKSCFVDSLIMNLAKIHQYKTLIYSPEGFNTIEHMFRFLCRFSKSSYDINHNKYLTDSQLKSGCDFLKKYFCWIDPMFNEEMTIDKILDLTESIILRMNINGLVIDPWNNLEHKRDRELSETEYIGMCLTRLKRFAVKYKIHIWIVAHPVKMQKKHDGNYGIVSPYDISGSANWFNKVDSAISIRRGSDLNFISEIYIQKAKTSNIGKIGQINLEFIGMYEDYKELNFENNYEKKY